MCWFVVVPDRPMLPSGLLARLRAGARSMVPYPSGRPWLLGSWPQEETVLASAGSRLLMVLGTSSTSVTDLSARLKGLRTVADLEGALRGVNGSFHVVASVDGHGYVRGSASGVRRIYRARAEGVTVCADRARSLAWLIGARPNTAQLAARLAAPCLPHPLADAAMWTGVEAVVPGNALHLEPDGTCRTTVWWHPPPGELPLPEGARHLRGALRDAVALRVRQGQVLAADLSGGMDSTALCFLAAEAGARLVTATQQWSTPGSQDHHYAQYAADRLPGIEALVFPSTELPAFFTGLDQRRDPPDGPWSELRGRARRQHIARALRARGAVLRLSGFAGDHIVVPPASYVHALLRRSPRVALCHTAGFRARSRWPLRATARLLMRPGSYPDWLTAASGRIREGAAAGAEPPTWGPRPFLPAWASAQASNQLAVLLHSAAEQAEPLAADPGQHAWLHQIREGGRIAGLIKEATTAEGLPTDSPFCDDAVLTACLAVRPEQAHTPWAYKPLLAAAMDGLVPAHLLGRSTKDHSGSDWYLGLKSHRRILADWADTSHLVAAGIADESALRQAFLSPGLNIGGVPVLENTLGAEGWLRDLAAHPVPAYLSPHPLREYPIDTTAR